MKYLCDYRYQGEQYSITIDADSYEDANARLLALRYNGKVVGEVVVSIPVPAPIVRLGRIWSSLKKAIADSYRRL